MIESMFSDDIKKFLGKYKVVYNRDDYEVAESMAVQCEDGRFFEQDIKGYGLISLDDPYTTHKKAIKSIVRKVEEAYAQTLPYMDRMMREKYKTFMMVKK